MKNSMASRAGTRPGWAEGRKSCGRVLLSPAGDRMRSHRELWEREIPWRWNRTSRCVSREE